MHTLLVSNSVANKKVVKKTNIIIKSYNNCVERKRENQDYEHYSGTSLARSDYN